MTSPFGEFLSGPGFTGPSGLRAMGREASVLREGGAFVHRLRAEKRRSRTASYAGPHRRATNQPVLLIPGFMAGDYSLRGMAQMLRLEGHRTYRAGILVNNGCTREAADRLERRLEVIAGRREQKVVVVGHSLGGMLARSLAARRPDLVAGIVTMGSPVLAPAAVHNLLARNADLLTRLTRAGIPGLMAEDCIAGACAQQAQTDMHRPLPEDFPFTAIYSRRDGFVDWRACLDPAARQIEVRTSHVGMAVDPVVIDHVVRTLREWQLSAASRQRAPRATDPAVRVAHR